MEGLLATYLLYPRDFVFEARFELINFLRTLSEKHPVLKDFEDAIIVNPFGYKGILLMDFRNKLKNVSGEYAQEIIRDAIDLFRSLKEKRRIIYIQRIFPFHKLVSTDIDAIYNAVLSLKHLIKGRWRITLKTRKWPINRIELIKKVAEPIELPVDLEHPEYEVIIQIVGKYTGILIVHHDESENK